MLSNTHTICLDVSSDAVDYVLMKARQAEDKAFQTVCMGNVTSGHRRDHVSLCLRAFVSHGIHAQSLASCKPAPAVNTLPCSSNRSNFLSGFEGEAPLVCRSHCLHLHLSTVTVCAQPIT